MRKRAEESPPPGAPEWMNTYGDMITLVLTFFVLMYSFSNLNETKYTQFVQSFSVNWGSGENPPSGLSDGNNATDVEPEVTLEQQSVEEFQELYKNMQEYVEANQLADQIEIKYQPNEMLINFTDNVLFDSGSAILKSGALDVLVNVANGLKANEDNISLIRVEGHTDNVPIKTAQFRNNWELSTARAVAVVEYFIDAINIEPAKMTASGYSEYHPVASNGTDEGRGKNRRVEIYLSRAVRNAEGAQ